MKTAVIIPSAGSGKRFGSDIPKQYQELEGIPAIIRTLSVFENIDEVDAIVVAVHADWEERFREMAKQYNAVKIKDIVIGGAERQDSVSKALLSSGIANADIVLVHDAARPFATSKLVRNIIAAASQFGAAIPTLTPKETVKLASNNGRIEKTLDRARLRLAQTPQGFRTEILLKAYSLADKMLFTDDAGLAEAAGFPIAFIAGEEKNIKITTPFDWSIAQILVNEQNKPQ